MGYVFVAKTSAHTTGALMLEEQCTWAVPDKFTEYGSRSAKLRGRTSPNFPCFEDGSNCHRFPAHG